MNLAQLFGVVPAKVIRDRAVKNGMTTMLQDGLRKVLAGQTSVDEVLRVAGE